MPYKEKSIEKLFYTIGEVAEIFQVNTSLIRYWEKEFDIIQPQKNKKGNRLFTQKDLDCFHLIFDLVKKRGYTLDGAKQKLKSTPKETEKQVQILKSLNHFRDFLVDLRESL